jgi:hypothetical protein
MKGDSVDSFQDRDDVYLDNKPVKPPSANLDIDSLNSRKLESDGKTAFTLEKILEDRKHEVIESESEEMYDWNKTLKE